MEDYEVGEKPVEDLRRESKLKDLQHTIMRILFIPLNNSIKSKKQDTDSSQATKVIDKFARTNATVSKQSEQIISPFKQIIIRNKSSTYPNRLP